MKKIFNILVLLWVSDLYAQPELFSRQYFLNNYLVNPAVGGVYDYMDARLSYSRQWTEIKDSPRSVLFTFNTNLSKEKDEILRYSYTDKRYKVMRGRLQSNDRRLKHGIGAKVVYDKVNVFSYTNTSISYACHVPLTSYWTISAGIAGGVTFSALDIGNEYVGNEDDPLLNRAKRNEVTAIFDAGVWIYSPGPYIGFSVNRAMENPYDEDSKNRYMSIYATAGWQLVYNEKFSFVPSVMYRNDGYSGTNIDLNAMLWFYETVWAGASLRRMENMSVHAGVLLGNRVEVNYTYDINKKKWGASHEIGVAYRIWRRANECKSKWYFR